MHAAFHLNWDRKRLDTLAVHGYFPPSLAEVETVAHPCTSLVLEDLTRWALSLHNSRAGEPGVGLEVWPPPPPRRGLGLWLHTLLQNNNIIIAVFAYNVLLTGE